MEVVPEDLARWAVGPGRGVIADVAAALAAGEDELAVGTRLRERVSPARAAFATAAAHARRRAVELGLPGAADLVLTREALEQASRPAAARWRAARAAVAWQEVDGAGPLQDRCAGTGGDAVALATHASVLAVERDPGRAVLAADRARVLGLPVEVRVGDALDPMLPTRGAVVHADPDRRDGRGRRARRLADHTPSLGSLLAATDAAGGRLLTVAPGVAWDDPDLPEDAEVVFLQEERDLVEAVLCTGAARRAGARATAVLLRGGEVMTRSRRDGPSEHLSVGAVGDHLLLPAPAAVRARVHDALGAELGARRLADRRALLTTDDAPPPSPWFTVERVEAVLPAQPRAVRDHLRGQDRRVELLLHGVDADVRAWLRRAGSPSTGPDDLRIHLVRRDDDAVAVLTS